MRKVSLQTYCLALIAAHDVVPIVMIGIEIKERRPQGGTIWD